ncbi:MAG TPA: hypothetical protein VIW24_04915 [Aldersonia sp.]
MRENEAAFRADMRDRMKRYLERREQVGDTLAREELMDGYPARQRACMDPYLETNDTLTGAIGGVLPLFEEQLGLQEEVVDCSNSETEMTICIMRTCLCRAAGQDLGIDDPPVLHCELSAAATSRAYPDIDAEVVLRQVRGSHVCSIRYTRPAAPQRRSDP